MTWIFFWAELSINQHLHPRPLLNEPTKEIFSLMPDFANLYLRKSAKWTTLYFSPIVFCCSAVHHFWIPVNNVRISTYKICVQYVTLDATLAAFVMCVPGPGWYGAVASAAGVPFPFRASRLIPSKWFQMFCRGRARYSHSCLPIHSKYN